jgi:hypothetical protein
MAPRIESFCGEHKAAERYILRLQESITRVLQRYEDDASLLVILTFAEGPRVVSACYADFKPTLETEELEATVTAATQIYVPQALACFAGHRLEHQATLNPVDYYGGSLPW